MTSPFSFVLDTNFFINLQRDLNLGQNKEEVLQNFSNLVSGPVKEGRLSLFTTPEAYAELSSFFTGQDELKTLSTILRVVSPNLNELKINAQLFLELIAETGKRLYRGLRVAEEVAKTTPTTTQNGPEDAGKQVAQLRDKYRRATREGFIDSTIDMGLILLSSERRAALVSSDNGLITWARKFGCEELLPEAFLSKIKELF